MPFKTTFNSSYLKPPDDLLVAAPGSGQWTILLWFKLNRVTGVQTLWYLNDGHALRVNGTALQFVYGAGADTIATVAAATWYCVTVTKNAATEVRYTVDGVYASNRTTSLSSSDAASAVIGCWGGSADWLYFTEIGPVKTWDRVLTANEIALESVRWLPEFTTSLRLFWPLLLYSSVGLGSYGPLEDLSGNGRTPIWGGYWSGSGNTCPPIPWGGPVQAVAEEVGVAVATKITYLQPGRMSMTSPGVTTTGGQALADMAPLLELAYDGVGDGKYSGCIPAAHIRGVKGGMGFRSTRAYLSDNSQVDLDLRNDGGQYTTGGGLWIGMWCKVRVAGSGEVLFTGRITELTPAYGVSNPYLSIRLDTSRNALNIPARSVLLQDTDTRAAALALLGEVDLTNSGGFFIFDRSLFDGPDLLTPAGADQVRTYGDQWMSLASAGGYGKSGGELDVLKALAELMRAEDGRAVWGPDNTLELYSRQYLDDVRDGEVTTTLTDDDMANLKFGLGSEYVNDLVLKWTPTRWETGAVVYTYEASATSVQAGAYKDFNVSFRLSGNDRVLAAENPVVVITQTGPTLAYTWAGGVKATGGTLRVTNSSGGGNSSEAATITKIVVTATALIQSDTAEVHLHENLGKTLYGVRPLVLTMPVIDRETQAVARAQREFAAYNERPSFAERIDLKPHTRADVLSWLTLPFATPINVQSTRLAHNARYLYIGNDWQIAEGARAVDVTLFLEPVTVNGLFTFDEEAKGFDAGRLA